MEDRDLPALFAAGAPLTSVMPGSGEVLRGSDGQMNGCQDHYRPTVFAEADLGDAAARRL